MSLDTTAENRVWFYELKGERKGPINQDDLIDLIKHSIISHGSSVWTSGFPDWMKVENTDLRVHLEHSGPPPLSGENVSNTIVWFLAFAPLIGYFLEWILAYSIEPNEIAAWVAMANTKYWFVTIALNIGLSIYDEKSLKKAGYNTSKFRGWVWIVPVYLYQRAKATKQSLSYFVVWLVCFGLVILS